MRVHFNTNNIAPVLFYNSFYWYLPLSKITKFTIVVCFLQAVRGKSPGTALMEEAAFGDGRLPTVLALGLAQGTNVILASSSASNNKYERIITVKGIGVVQVKLLCDYCALQMRDNQSKLTSDDEYTVCKHCFINLPRHILQTTNKNFKALQEVMDIADPYAFSQEVLGNISYKYENSTEMFPNELLKIFSDNTTPLDSEEVKKTLDIIVAVDPVLNTGTRQSGIGVCIILRLSTNDFVVSIHCYFA